jgi:hypothetical protein
MTDTPKETETAETLMVENRSRAIAAFSYNIGGCVGCLAGMRGTGAIEELCEGTDVTPDDFSTLEKLLYKVSRTFYKDRYRGNDWHKGVSDGVRDGSEVKNEG